jgi:hypothetical protein
MRLGDVTYASELLDVAPGEDARPVRTVYRVPTPYDYGAPVETTEPLRAAHGIIRGAVLGVVAWLAVLSGCYLFARWYWGS